MIYMMERNAKMFDGKYDSQRVYIYTYANVRKNVTVPYLSFSLSLTPTSRPYQNQHSLSHIFLLSGQEQSGRTYRNDPQPGVVREPYPWTAMCVRNVDVHVSCSSQVDAQLAAFFIDPRAK